MPGRRLPVYLPIAGPGGGAHSAIKREPRGQPKAPPMPVDHPAGLAPAVPLPHLRKIAFATGALLMALALYAAHAFFG